MKKIKAVCITLPVDLLQQIDRDREDKHMASRSEYIRSIIREHLAKKAK